MSKFKVGEIAIYIRNGWEMEILDLPKPRTGPDRDGNIFHCSIPAYETKAPDGHIGWVTERLLRKKKPPQETTTWEAIQELTNWSPEVVHE